MDLASVCIRCGSKTHTTRDHDEGKVGGAASPSPVKKTRPGSAKQAASPGEASPRRTNLYLETRLTPDRCWKSVGRSPGIPDVIDPPIMERSREGCYLSFQTAMPHALKMKCPCAECKKREEKMRRAALMRQGKD